MKNRKILSSLAAFVVSASIAFGAAAQPPGWGSTPTHDALFWALHEVGAVRQPGSRELRAVLRVLYWGDSGVIGAPLLGSGYQAAQNISAFSVEMHYGQPAMRADYQLANGERVIQAVRADVAWNEGMPGRDFSASNFTADDLRWQIWLTPHGVLWAALDAIEQDALAMTTEAGKTVMSFSKDGNPIRLTLGADSRPESVAVTLDGHSTLGSTTVTAHYSDYRNWELLDVYFPAQIRWESGGQTLLQLQTDDYRTNPYVIIRYPEGIQ